MEGEWCYYYGNSQKKKKRMEDGIIGMAVGGVLGVDMLTSTGFLERFLPLCMCLSQYFESG
ncbi:hypothetical protein HanRHA438_Chr12g0532731 [Helianthus annuus]|nr:hypothetical protein HanRHA438_Chr12g0532731 [Helianthus annuus]